AARRVEATPERRFAPERLCASRNRGRRISAAIAAVVVFPFVAETTAVPAGSRAASRSTAPGSTIDRSFPGTVIPAPAPTRRERPATARAAATSAASGTRIQPNLAMRGCICELSNLIYHTCHGEEATFSCGGADRPATARGVPGGHPQAVHGRADRRRAA